MSPDFLRFAREQLAQCEEGGRNELLGKRIQDKKTQYLFMPPQGGSFLMDLIDAIGELTGLPAACMTLSERHFEVYDQNAAARPFLHKDSVTPRLRSEYLCARLPRRA